MKVVADLCVIPIGVGLSVSKQVAVCEQILTEAGLKTKLHAYGTNIEGDWDIVFAAVKRFRVAVLLPHSAPHQGRSGIGRRNRRVSSSGASVKPQFVPFVTSISALIQVCGIAAVELTRKTRSRACRACARSPAFCSHSTPLR